jgi:predicted ATP-dependent endonuclease of OLD family
LTIGFENNFQILVGLNEAGKSNILKALSFIDADIEPEKDDIRDPSHDETPIDSAYVRYVFGLTSNEIDDVYNTVKSKFKMIKINTPLINIGDKSYSLQQFCEYKHECLYVVDLQEKTKAAKYWSLSGSHYTTSKAWKEVPTNWTEYEHYDRNDFKYICIEDYPEHENDTDLKDCTVASINSVVGEAMIQIVNNHLINCIVWSYNENNLLPGRIDIEAFKNNPNICEPLKNMFHLAGYNNIPKKIVEAEIKKNGMRNLLRKLSDNSTKLLNKVWPEYKILSIDLTQNGSVIEAGIEDEYNVYSLDRRSDGFKRFISFLLMISAKVRADYLHDTLIIIDEPDIGLHLNGIQFLRDELIKIAKNNIIVIATHSIFMVDKDRIDRHLIVKKEKEETTITSDYTSSMLDEEVIYRALGYSLFELLKNNNVIFEGWSDKYTFQCWLNSRKAKKEIKSAWNNVGLIHALGAKDVKRVANNLDNLDRKYIVLTDADKPSLEKQKEFDGKHKWLTYKDLGFDDKETIEDFIENVYINKMINNILKREKIDARISFGPDDSFNKKMDAISKSIGNDSKELKRLKKLIKNTIFDNLIAKYIYIEKLVEAIDISSK